MKAFKILQVFHPRLLKVPTIHPPHCWGVSGPSGPNSLAKRPSWEPFPHTQESAGTPREELRLDVAPKWSPAKPRGHGSL